MSIDDFPDSEKTPFTPSRRAPMFPVAVLALGAGLLALIVLLAMAY